MLKLKKSPLIILTFSLLVSFLIAETTLRLVQIKPINILSCRRPDMIYHHGFVPSSQCRFKTQEWDITYQINQFGLRDDEFELQKPNDKKRLLILGDSFAEGYGVQMKQAFPYLIELELVSLVGNKYQVINAGVSGRSPLMEYFYLKEEGVFFEPDLVILALDLTDFHDDYLAYKQAVFNQQGAPVAIPDERLKPLLLKKLSIDPPQEQTQEPLTTPQETTKPTTPQPPSSSEKQSTHPNPSTPEPILNKKFNITSDTLLPQLSLNTKKLLHKSLLYSKTVQLIKQILNQTPPSWNWQLGNPNEDVFAVLRPLTANDYSNLIQAPVRSILLINQLLKNQNIDFAVILFPHGHQLSPTAWRQGRLEHGFQSNKVYATSPQQDLKTILAEENITTIDLIPDFKSANNPDKLYFQLDGHFTAQGHRFFTDSLFNNLQFLSLVRD